MKPRRGDILVPSFISKVEKVTEIEHYLQENLPHMLDEDLFVVEILIKGTLQRPLIYLLLDGDDGITIDKCAEISRKIKAWLESELEPDDYLLEVSSPGIDKPLKMKRQYKRHTGKKLKVTLNDDTVVTGELLTVVENEIKISAERKVKKKILKEEQKIPFDEIKKTNVLVSFK